MEKSSTSKPPPAASTSPLKDTSDLKPGKLQQRDIRQVIGLAFMNQAAVSWHKNAPETAIALYEKARLFLGDNDYLLNMFLGFNYLFVGREKEGAPFLRKSRESFPTTPSLPTPLPRLTSLASPTPMPSKPSTQRSMRAATRSSLSKKNCKTSSPNSPISARRIPPGHHLASAGPRERSPSHSRTLHPSQSSRRHRQLLLSAIHFQRHISTKPGNTFALPKILFMPKTTSPTLFRNCAKLCNALAQNQTLNLYSVL